MSGGRGGQADGRVLRGRRNREAVVEALLDLVVEGRLKPTAKEIADRAGISRRSVFQHFADVESIYQEVVARVAVTVKPMLADVDPTLSLTERLAAVVALRRTLLVTLDPFARSARLREPFSAELAASRARIVDRMVEQCRSALAPELDELPDPDARLLLTGVSAALSWATWDYLRADCGLDEDTALATMTATATALVEARVSQVGAGFPD